MSNTKKEFDEKHEIEENSTSKAKNYVISTLFNTSLFVVMSFVTKAINLVFTVLIARIIAKESYGLATVYFNFLFILLLYFPKETLRKTCLRFCTDEDEEVENTKFKQACHLIWYVNFAVFFTSIPLTLIFIFFGGGVGNSKGLAEYKIHLLLYAFSALLELIAEPAVIFLSIKIDKQYRLIGMTLANYTRLAFNYLLAIFFGFDLWSFTLSRLIASVVFLIYMLYVGMKIYRLQFSVFIPDFSGIKSVMKDAELNTTLVSFSKGTLLKMVLNFAERFVLSFYLQVSDSNKAEYTFIVENFATFVKYFIEPAEENFYNLINKIKHYKGLKVVPTMAEDFSGDFSANENEILMKLYSAYKGKKDKDKENYSYKLLKLSLKLFIVFGILLFSYLFIVGKDLIIFIFTEKWGTEHTISILKAYSLYIGVLAINSVAEAYTTAICPNYKINIFNSFMIMDAILLISLSLFLAHYDITGLVWANIITLTIRFFFNIYLIISTEIEMQNKNQNELNGNILAQECIKSGHILIESVKFLSKSFLKIPAIISTLICLIILNLIKDLLHFDETNQPLILSSAGIVLCLNILLIFMVEKKGFIEIIRLKTSGIRM